MKKVLFSRDEIATEKLFCRCAATRKAGLKLLFLTEIPLLVVTPLCSLRNPPLSLSPPFLAILLFWLAFAWSRPRPRSSLSLSLSPSLLRSFSSFPASRKRPTATATVTDRARATDRTRPTGQPCSARGKIPFIPVADYDLAVGRILVFFYLSNCGG